MVFPFSFAQMTAYLFQSDGEKTDETPEAPASPISTNDYNVIPDQIVSAIRYNDYSTLLKFGTLPIVSCDNIRTARDALLEYEILEFNADAEEPNLIEGKSASSMTDTQRLEVAERISDPKGKLFVDGFIEEPQYTFLDYISSGFELNFMVAIDFTASNGCPRRPDSLHYIDPSGRLNAYQQAIIDVGEVLQFYDSDKMLPAWGFGGRMYNGLVSHCFNLNGSTGSFEVEGIQGIMAAYENALHTLILDGPTLFGHVINQAADLAAQSQSQSSTKYFVLLIITGGALTDLQETKDALVRASDLPLSILIVGVGEADFTVMEVLDANIGQRLESSTGRIAARDIVRFVSIRDVHRGEMSRVQGLLEELPGQFLTYMRNRDVRPHNLILNPLIA